MSTITIPPRPWKTATLQACCSSMRRRAGCAMLAGTSTHPLTRPSRGPRACVIGVQGIDDLRAHHCQPSQLQAGMQRLIPPGPNRWRGEGSALGRPLGAGASNAACPPWRTHSEKLTSLMRVLSCPGHHWPILLLDPRGPARSPASHDLVFTPVAMLPDGLDRSSRLSLAVALLPMVAI